MKHVAKIILLSTIGASIAFALSTRTATNKAPRLGYQVVNAYPHDRKAFTEGLVYTDGVLYESVGLNGQSDLRKIDLKTGKVLQRSVVPPEYFAEGLTVVGNKLIQLTWQTKTGFVYHRDSFKLLHSFAYPTEGWGLTYDGKRLIMSDGSENLYFLDPVTQAVLGSVKVNDAGSPVRDINELEFVDGQIYANVWKTNRIARIDPNTGKVTAWIDLSGLLPQTDSTAGAEVLNGIAYDAKNKRLFVTGKWWPFLFEIKLVPKP
jgi:glutaminyl-peptide cyclotransferase